MTKGTKFCYRAAQCCLMYSLLTGTLLFFICKLSFCLFCVARFRDLKDRNILSPLSLPLLQPPAALLSNDCHEYYFQMGGIWDCAILMCTGIDYLSPHLSHFTSVLSLIFLRDLKNVMKAAPPNLYQRLRFRKALGHVSVLVSRASQAGEGLRPGKFPLLQQSS